MMRDAAQESNSSPLRGGNGDELKPRTSEARTSAAWSPCLTGNHVEYSWVASGVGQRHPGVGVKGFSEVCGALWAGEQGAGEGVKVNGDLDWWAVDVDVERWMGGEQVQFGTAKVAGREMTIEFHASPAFNSLRRLTEPKQFFGRRTARPLLKIRSKISHRRCLI